MNVIDMFIGVLLIWAVFRGYTRGFIMQLATLAALALGIFAALKLSGLTAQQLEGKLNMSGESLKLVSMAITFLLVFVGVNLVGRIVEKIAESADLSFLNRLMGVVLSVAKTVIIAGVLLAFINRLDLKIHFLPENSRENSVFFEPFTRVATTIFPSLSAPPATSKNTKQV